MRTGLRRLAPPSGRAYELFDCSVLLLVLWFVGYVLTTPTSNQEAALAGPYLFLPSTVWGAVMTLCAVVGIVCSYTKTKVGFGYVVTIAASGFWAALFAVGASFHNVDSLRAMIVVILYCWIARRLIREEDRDWEPNCDSDKTITRS